MLKVRGHTLRHPQAPAGKTGDEAALYTCPQERGEDWGEWQSHTLDEVGDRSAQLQLPGGTKLHTASSLAPSKQVGQSVYEVKSCPVSKSQQLIFFNVYLF